MSSGVTNPGLDDVNNTLSHAFIFQLHGWSMEEGWRISVSNLSALTAQSSSSDWTLSLTPLPARYFRSGGAKSRNWFCPSAQVLEKLSCPQRVSLHFTTTGH
ncbi:uncharacterized [Tachysurus ichikawai]